MDKSITEVNIHKMCNEFTQITSGKNCDLTNITTYKQHPTQDFVVIRNIFEYDLRLEFVHYDSMLGNNFKSYSFNLDELRLFSKKFFNDNLTGGELVSIYYSSCSVKIGVNNVVMYSENGTVRDFRDYLDEIHYGVSSLATNKNIITTRNYAFRIHDIECNQWYDKELELRYSHHLQMVADIGARFINILPLELRERAIQCCYLHDCVEDARVTYNDLKKLFGEDVAADSCSLCTNIHGFTRDDRANSEYYDRVSSHIVRVFGKFCDRIANMEHGLHFGSMSMVKKYASEMESFLEKLNTYTELDPMREHLRMLEYRSLYNK